MALDGFFKQFTEPKKRDANPSSSNISTARASAEPRSDASTPIPRTRPLILSPKRAWQSPDARKRRRTGDASRRGAGMLSSPQPDNLQQEDAAPHLGGSGVEAPNGIAPITSKTQPAESLVQSYPPMDTSDVRENEVVVQTGLEPTPSSPELAASRTAEPEDVILSIDGANDEHETEALDSRKASSNVVTPSTVSSSTSPRSSGHRPSRSESRPSSVGVQRVASLTNPPTSSLTTLPDTLSFSSTSTKRKLKDGMEVVRNSDTESESEDSDPLEDLEVIVARAAANRKPSAPTAVTGSVPTSASAAGGRNLRSIGARGTVATGQKPKYKITLDSLLKNKPSSQEEEELDELRSLSDSDEDKAFTNRAPAVDEGAIEAVIPDDEEDPGHAKRVLQAMQRTDAFKEERAYYYLDPNADVRTNPPAFPTASLPHNGWQHMLRKPGQRQQLFSSGLAAKLSKDQPLPTEVLLWILDSVCIGTSELLSLRYLEVLEQSKESLKDLINNDKFLQKRLDRLGARDGVFMDQAALVSRRTTGRSLPKGLRWFLELLQMLLADFDQEASIRVIQVLTKLLVDERVSKDGSTFILVQDTLAAMLSQADGSLKTQVQQSIFTTWKVSSLQEALVQALPARNRASHAFRRQIAYAFAVHTPGTEAPSVPSNVEGFAKVTEHVRNLAKHSQGTDYAELASNIAMLDVAIDAGFSDGELPSGSEREKSFNEAVSKLAAAIRELESGLIGGGLSNLHKSTAKAALDQLWCRLQYAVRTMPPPQKDFLAGFDEERERKVRFMTNWAKVGQGD